METDPKPQTTRRHFRFFAWVMIAGCLFTSLAAASAHQWDNAGRFAIGGVLNFIAWRHVL